MITIDTHTHAGPNWFEPIEMLVCQMELNGVDKAVLIQHGRPEFGHYDHEYLFQCLDKYPGKFAIVVILDTKNINSLRDLERYRERGAVGIRLNPDTRSPGPDSLAIWRQANDLGMFVSAMGTVEGFASDQFTDVVGELPELPIILEHLAGGGEGASFPRNGKGPEKPYLQFNKAMELSKFPNVYIKVHGLGEIINRPNVLNKNYITGFYGELPPLIDIAKDAFGVDHMMWGSDYPPVSGREGYRNALMGVKEYPAFDKSDEIEWVMGKTALKVINFYA